jgi:hypothetical protein
VAFQPRFLLDEDVSPRVAVIARGLGLDVTSIHELDRTGLSDFEQLRRAAEDRRIFVTFNRDDYIHWTREFFRGGLPHHGVLILSRALPRDAPDRLAHALAVWAAAAVTRYQDDRDAEYLLALVP